MSSRGASQSARRPPRVRVAPPRRGDTYGDLACSLASSYGLIPDDWQELVLSDWLRVRAGRWASLDCGLSCPRQNGKNAILEVYELFVTVGLGRRVLHTAHEVKTGRKHFRRLRYFFGERAADPGAEFQELNKLVREIRNVNGQEGIYLTNGGSIELVARSKSSGRGFTVDTLVCDEAQELTDDELQAINPSISAAPSGDPQTIFAGTPPGPRASGEVFTKLRRAALSRTGRTPCWHEWSLEGEVDLDDREGWYAANPALGHRLSLEVVEAERSKYSDAGFARERLGMWDQTATAEVIDQQIWADLKDPASRAASRITLGIDVSPDRSTATVAVAGLRQDGRWHVGIDQMASGTAWIAAWVEQRCQQADVRGVVVDGASQAATMIDELRARRIRVTSTGVHDMAQACGQFYDCAMQGDLRHIGQIQLAVALASARPRPVLSGQAWAWNRKNVDADITPVVAATLALWGAQSAKTKRAVRPGSGGGRVTVL